ncbi:MAG TPA: hypothetical protein VFF73_22240, partial [Planctomycetota bacterium]|nr:hypothetical protein [Planctomycetota bacterium]
IHWLAAIRGERRLVIVSDLELDVVGDDDAPEPYLRGLPADADRETVNRHARDLLRDQTLARLRELDVKPIVVKLALPEDARLVSVEEDLAALPGARVLDGSLAADDLSRSLSELLPKKAPPPAPPAPAPLPVPVPVPAPVPAPAPAPAPVATTTPHEEPSWNKLVGAVLIGFAVLSLMAILVKTRRAPLGGRRLVPLGADGRPLEDEVVLERKKTQRGIARLELGSGALELHARKDGGVNARPKGVKASIEGVPVQGPTALVHGMVVHVEDKEGKPKPFVYLDRPLNASERRRAWIEASDVEETPVVESTGDDEKAKELREKRRKNKRAFLSASKETISDVASVDEIIVVDDSQDTTQAGWLMFGARQVVALDDAGTITGDPLYFRSQRLDADKAVFELEGKELCFRVDQETGAHLEPPGPRVHVTIEGVPVGESGAAFVHGMTFTVEGRKYLYLDRDPGQSERLRVHGLEAPQKDSVSDVGSVDDIYVMDDSEENEGKEQES